MININSQKQIKYFPCASKYLECLNYGQSENSLRIFPVFIQIQINHQPDATVFQFIILTFIYSSTCFGRFPAHH